MFLPDYKSKLNEPTENIEQENSKIFLIFDLLTSHKFDILDECYESYKILLDNREHLETITCSIIGLEKKDDLAIIYIKTKYKVFDIFEKNHFSENGSYMLQLRNAGRYDAIKFIYDNNL
jgi:hypothetical protein